MNELKVCQPIFTLFYITLKNVFYSFVENELK